MQMQDVRAIVTGGASGLGLAVAEMRGRAPAARSRCSTSMTQAGHRRRAGSSARHASFHKVDVTSEPAVDCRGAAAAASCVGGLNVAINCAGIGWPRRLVGKDGPMPGDFFRKVIEINLVGTLLVCKARGRGDAAEHAERRRRARRHRHDRLGRRVRRPDRPGRVLRVEGRPRRHDVADGARARELRHPRDDDCAGDLRDADARRSARRSEGVARQAGAVSVAPRRNRRSTRSFVRQIVENPMLNGETIRLDGAIRMAPR